MMEVWNSSRLAAQLQTLKQKERLDTESLVMYILNPFISSLGYDIYDIQTVDTQVQSGRVVVQALEQVTIIFSVTSIFPAQSGEMFVQVDAKGQKLHLHLYALNKWELVETVDLALSPEDIEDSYKNIMRMIAQESCHILYAERGARMFTERILAAKLSNGDMDNDFLLSAITSLFNSPSQNFLHCIAETLGEQFSTESTETIKQWLKPLAETGIREMVSRYLKESMNFTGTTTTRNTPTAFSLPENKPEEVVQQVEEVPVTTVHGSGDLSGLLSLAEGVTKTQPAKMEAPAIMEAVEVPVVKAEQVEVEEIDAAPAVAEKEPERSPTSTKPPAPLEQGRNIGALDRLLGSSRKIPPTKGLN